MGRLASSQRAISSAGSHTSHKGSPVRLFMTANRPLRASESATLRYAGRVFPLLRNSKR